MYEEERESKASNVWRSVAFFASTIVMAMLYFWIYTSVLGLESPKTILLKKTNDRWCSKVEVMNSNLDKYQSTLEALELRDDDIYRSIFGMNEISSEVRNAGFGGVNRYGWLEEVDRDGLLRKTPYE